MKNNLTRFSRHYRQALGHHLSHPVSAALVPAAVHLGRKAMQMRLEILDLARIHDQALEILVTPNKSGANRATLGRRAGSFFACALTPIEALHHSVREALSQLDRQNRVVRRRSRELAASNRQLKKEIIHRRTAENALRNSRRHYGQLLAHSRRMQEQLRFLSRQLLSIQEMERKKISRELHDVVAQTLTGIIVHLATLKKEALVNTRGLELNIARTQELVEHSVHIVHRFARELRPPILDDLGLLPALQTFMKHFLAETGIHVSLSAFAAVEQINGDRRTTLYRVAQEALTNVARHARASRVHVTIRKMDGAIHMKIKDNGHGFLVDQFSRARLDKRLGLLGMTERLEMIGGTMSIKSAPGAGTTVHARIPLDSERPRRKK